MENEESYFGILGSSSDFSGATGLASCVADPGGCAFLELSKGQYAT